MRDNDDTFSSVNEAVAAIEDCVEVAGTGLCFPDPI